VFGKITDKIVSLFVFLTNVAFGTQPTRSVHVVELRDHEPLKSKILKPKFDFMFW